MQLRLFLAFTLVFVLTGAGAEEHRHDVVVYGATAGGAMAAIAAANAGLSVALLEPGRHVGGMISGGLGRTDHGNKAVIGGMSRAFFERVGAHYGADITWYFEPHVAERVLRDWLEETPSVQSFFGERVDSLTKENAEITGLTTLSGNTFRGAVFIDASYEGDLLPRAGISYTWGREGQEMYGESLAGRIEYSEKHQFQVPVSPYADDGTLIPLVFGGDAGKAGQGDQKVQAYNFRLCLTQNKDNQVPYPKPAGYDRARYDLLERYLAARPETQLREILSIGEVENGKTDINNNGPVSTDHIGASWRYPEANYEERTRIWQDHVDYVQGFFYFLSNDPSVPRPLQDDLNSWGLAKDEFVDTDNWPHQMYIREARRMVGDYVMQQKDLQTERSKADSVGMGSYNSDSHHVQRIPVQGSPHWPADVPGVLNEGDMQVPVRPYEIAYRALTPTKEECTNLLVPVCFSASHVAYSSMRMEPQYMILGHTAGVAAAMAIATGRPVQEIDVQTLRQTLRAQNQVLSLEDASGAYIDAAKLEGIVVDNEHAELTGAWNRSTAVGPFIGLEYIHVDPDAPGVKRARFIPDLPNGGAYEVRFAYSAHPNRASNVPITIHTAAGPLTVTVDQRKATGETDPFLSLGTYRFTAGRAGVVEVSNEGVDGFVVADAVQWLAKE
jgi:hypothetical protein